MKYRNRRVLALGLCIMMLSTQALAVSADTDDEIAAAQSQLAQTNAELSVIETSISDMETQKAAILAEIDGYDQELVTTIAAITALDNQVLLAEQALEETGVQLAAAEEDQEIQYEAMKKRIQYLYEEGGSNGWVDIMLGDTSISVGMNDIDNTQSLYEYDRDELDAYTETIDQVTALKTQQEQQKSELETMRLEQQEAKENLEVLKANAQAESDDYETQIANAEATAALYYALIQEQNNQIAVLQAQKAAEEEAARIAAEEAARAAAEEAARQNASTQTNNASAQNTTDTASAADSVDNSGYTDTTTDNNSYNDTSAADTSYTDDTYTDNSDSDTSYDDTYTDTTDYSSDTSSDTGSEVYYDGSTGQAVVNYALQFVGNPYVWGGTSLTNGADCSGFVQSVFANFGVSLSRTTYTQANEGIAVSYNEMIPGDVINYGGHTAIYMGNNQIVHAASSSLGIIVQDNPAYQPIVTIRRFV